MTTEHIKCSPDTVYLSKLTKKQLLSFIANIEPVGKEDTKCFLLTKSDCFSPVSTVAVLVTNKRIILARKLSNAHSYEHKSISLSAIELVKKVPTSSESLKTFTPNFTIVLLDGFVNMRCRNDELGALESVFERVLIAETSENATASLVEAKTEFESRSVPSEIKKGGSPNTLQGWGKSQLYGYFSLVLAVIGLGLIGYSYYYDNYTAEGMLEAVFEEYDRAFEEKDVDKALSILTPYSRNNIDKEKWVKLVLEWRKGQETKLESIYFEDGGKVATVGYVVTLENRTEYLSNKWHIVDGRWHRAFVEENPKYKIDGGVGVKDELKGERKLAVYSASYDWDASSSFGGDSLLRPRVKIKLKNVGAQPIKRLTLKARFYKVDDQSTFAEENDYAIGNNDLPLQPNQVSQDYFLTSGVGLDVSKLLAMYVDYPEQIVTKELRKTQKNIKVEVYYKLSNDDEWSLLEIDWQ